MGVHGLWNLLEPAGKPIPLETLENKILAIDVSIWLNQAVKGFRDNEGGAVPNAHLLVLFQRICKLLFYRIRPIFVFDGKAPELKRETLRRRRHKTSNETKKSRIAGLKILDNFVKRQVVASQLQRQTIAVKKALEDGQDGLAQLIQKRTGKGQVGPIQKDLFELPPLPNENVGLNSLSNVEYSSDDDDFEAVSYTHLTLPTNREV